VICINSLARAVRPTDRWLPPILPVGFSEENETRRSENLAPPRNRVRLFAIFGTSEFGWVRLANGIIVRGGVEHRYRRDI